MKKKLFSLLTLALLGMSSAWAEEVTVGRTAAFSADTHENTLLPASNSNLTVTIADGTQSMGAKTANSSTKELCYKSTDKVKIDAFLCYRTQIDGSGLGAFNENAYAGFKVVIADGMKLKLSAINGKVATADDGTVCRIIVEDEAGNALQTSSDKTVNRNGGNDFTISSELQLTGTVYVKMHYWTTKLNNGAPHASKYMTPVELTIDGNLTALTEPNINSTPSSITLNATESGTPVNSSFTIKGSYLTPGNYNLTIPSVSGLSVSPTSFTVAADGTVNQVINVSYSSTENVPENVANITANVDGINLNVAVNYSASVIAWTLQTISSETIWDFSKVTGGVEYSGDDLTVEHVYANIAELTFDSSFDGTALAFTGRYPLRSGKACAQDGTLHFKTSVPGTIIVKFSDTGTSKSTTAVKRYLVVNGNTTEYWTSRENNGTENPYAAQLNVTTEGIAVPAGDVTITGTSALVMTYVKFTPVAATKINLNASGYATLSAYYPVEVSGAKAYTATLDFENSKITCAEITGGQVPAGAGVLLYGDPNAEVTLTPIASAAALGSNDLKGTTKADGTLATKGSENYYVLSGDTFKKFTGDAFGANKAYFEVAAGASPARLAIVFDDGTTGIKSVSNGQSTMNNEVYDLQGRRVAQPTKGLYIVNGKKVIK